jgi:hypothetical protein
MRTQLSRLVALGAALILATLPVSSNAQTLVARNQLASSVPAAGDVADAATILELGRAHLGEKAIYDVEVRGHGVGQGSLEIVGRETLDGHTTLHSSLRIQGSLFLMKVNDKIDTWFDPNRFISRRFQQDQHEIRSSRQKNYLISPEQKVFRETFSNSVDSLVTDAPLDDISMLYFARTLPLRVGDVDTIPRYFKPGHTVIISVLRREAITVPAGTFNTIVVQPTITNAGGLFGQGGKAEVYLSDDVERNVVMIRSSIPVLGSLSLTLRELVPAQQ